MIIIFDEPSTADVIVAMSNSGTVKVWALSSELSSNMVCANNLEY